MKLRTYFSLSVTFFLLIVAIYIYNSYKNYKFQYAQLLSERAIGVSKAFEKTFTTLFDTEQIDLLKPIIAAMAQRRHFLEYAALSLDGKTVTYASDGVNIGKVIPDKMVLLDQNASQAILKGHTLFYLPFEYFDKNKTRHAKFILRINDFSSKDLIRNIYISFLVFGIGIALFFSIVFLLIRRHLIFPIQSFDRFVFSGQKSEKPLFFISEFNHLYDRLSQNYKVLQKHEKSLEAALYTRDYLYGILSTMDHINRLLISDRVEQDILDACCKKLAEHSHYHLAWIGFVRQNTIQIISHSYDPTNYLSHLHLSTDSGDETYIGPTVQCIVQNKAVLLQSLNHPSFVLWQELAKTAGHGSMIAFPLRENSGTPPFGSLTIYSTRPYGFLTDEITMLEDLAGDIGYAIVARRKKEELHKALTTDALTGLGNRALLVEILQTSDSPELLLFDINRFYEINSVYGFDAGDFILQACAHYLKEVVDRTDAGTLFRSHGNTFAILLKKSQKQFDTKRFAEIIFAYFNENVLTYESADISISLSASYCDEAQHIIENGEIALKYAKRLKLPFYKFDSSMRMNREQEENLHWYKIIRDAIKEDRIVPYFQGIADTKTEKIVKYEALMRLIMPDGTVISPYTFIDIAKKTGLYTDLTKIMISKVIKIFCNRLEKVSINLSTEDILSDEIAQFIRVMLQKEEIGEQIIFEILESEGINNYDAVMGFIEEFALLGCQFAIDDFGSGFSNFEHLIKLRIDFLKIDGSLVKNLINDTNAHVIVKNIHSFASEMGIETIAEFVSSQEIFHIVKQLGIDYAQGYYFSEPAPL